MLSGLQGMGLGNLENLKIFEDEKSRAGKTTENPEDKIPTEEEMIYDRTMECPVCEQSFVTKIVKANRARLLKTDLDLRAVYEGVDRTKYDVIQCYHCGYSALSRYFDQILVPQKKLIREMISKNVSLKIPAGLTYSYEEAIDRNKLALANAVVKRAKNSEKAYVCLKTAWLLRGYREYLEAEGKEKSLIEETLLAEKEYLQNAYEGFTEARQSELFPLCGMDQNTMDYLLAALGYEVEDYTNAAKLISGLLVSNTVNKRTKDKALELKMMIVKKMKDTQNT